MFMLGGKRVAGVGPLQDPGDPPHVAWMVGGEMVGGLMMLADPHGAGFGIVAPEAQPAAEDA